MAAGSATLFVFGLALLSVSWVVLLITSWKEDYAWGLFTVLLPPVSYLFALFQLDKAGQAILLAIAGWVLIFLA